MFVISHVTLNDLLLYSGIIIRHSQCIFTLNNSADSRIFSEEAPEVLSSLSIPPLGLFHQCHLLSSAFGQSTCYKMILIDQLRIVQLWMYTMCAILDMFYRELHLASFLIFSITSPCHQDFRAVTLLIKLINSLHPNLSFFLPASVSCVRRELELLVLNQTGNNFWNYCRCESNWNVFWNYFQESVEKSGLPIVLRPFLGVPVFEVGDCLYPDHFLFNLFTMLPF